MLQPVIQGMGRVLAYFYSVIPNYGIAIILLTVIVRVLMIPLAIKQMHSMQANRGNQEKIRQLAPEVKRLKEKYKNDRARQYEEQKKLYEKHDVNMLGGLSGCVPMLLQAPIFMAMYAVLQGCDKLLGGTCELGNNIPTDSALHQAIVEGKDMFLGINLNLSPAQVWGDGSFLGVLPYAALVGVMGGSMWFQSKQMMRMQPTTGDPQMAQTQKIMQFMPLMIVVFSINFPAGLTVYWTASNFWTISQQYVLLKKIGGPLNGAATGAEKVRPATAAALKSEDGPKKKTGPQPSKGAKGQQKSGSGSQSGGTKGKSAEGGKGRPTPKRPPKNAPAGGKSTRKAASGPRGGAKRTQGGSAGGGSGRKPNKGQE